MGNGINIQFDRHNYTTQQIVLRVLKNCDRDDFPSHIIVNYPYLMKNYLGKLYLEAREMMAGEYDTVAFSSAEKSSLKAFKERYTENSTFLRMTDIGFEDYYLIHDLVSHKLNIQNPEQFYVREAMKVAYLFAIYNDGKLNTLYNLYPLPFCKYLSNFDNIFTTNYDSNIESATEKKSVFHIHGQFDKKSDVYEADSFRNQLPDSPIKNIPVDETYYYLYSNALSTHCGEYKEFQVKQNSIANDAVEKFVIAYKTDEKMRAEIDSWVNESNQLTANMGYGIQLKAAHPELCFLDNYHFDELKMIEGELEILGLSPWNDFHIFEAVNNTAIQRCIYYFFLEEETERIKELLPKLNANGNLFFKPVVEFWSEYDEK